MMDTMMRMIIGKRNMNKRKVSFEYDDEQRKIDFAVL